MSGALEVVNQVSGAVLAAVLNCLWQSAALAAAAWAGMRFTTRLNAATRHLLWWVVLAAIMLLPATPLIMARWQALTAPAPLAVRGEPLKLQASPEPDRDRPAATPAASVRPVPVASSEGPVRLPARGWPIWIAGLWAVAMVLQLSRVVWSYGHLRHLKRRARRGSPELRRNFDAWRLSCGVHRPAQLLISSEIVSPMAVGFRQPAVILPAPLLDQFQEPELDHVLLHELAHVARQDDWSNLYARLIGAVLCLHPVAAWVLRQIEREREMACDDWVVSMTGEARPYAASLARLFEICLTRRRMVLASGMAQRSSHLGERIQMLLQRRGEAGAKVSMSRLVLCASLLLALAVAGAQTPQWLVFAPEPLPAPAAPPATPADQATPAPSVAPTPAAFAATPAPQAVPAPSAESAPALAPTPGPPEALYSRQQRIVQQMVQLETRRAELAQRYSPRHPDMVRIQEQIVALQSEVQSFPRATPPPAIAGSSSGSFLADLVAAGYGNLSVDEIIDLKFAGVTGQFLLGMNQSGWGKLSPKELIEVSHRGIAPEYVRKIKEAGLKDVTLQDVTELATHGVRPELIQEIHALGFGPYTAKQALQFSQFGLRIDLFRALKDAGFVSAAPAEIVEAFTSGLSARNIEQARQYGPNLTLKQVIKLRLAGVL
ncbi:MAG TPA: M56 family metallopeptidase [Bryobacteraceae bacterium]|nr:M56 family metallopeptidase [Bryobacteraceae bacterium]